jgi:PIN domain nuclease of toxin-antitoxin system
VNVFDASALLCFLLGEPGSDAVERELELGGVCSSANWSEVAQKVYARDRNWDFASGLLLSFPLAVEPVTILDAELAARKWHPRSALSLGDRLCLALTQRLGGTAWTTDTAWGTDPPVRQVR